MKKIIGIVGASLLLSPLAWGQQLIFDKSQPTGKCWKVDMRSEADFYAKGWAKRNGFVGIVLLDESIRYVKEDRINEIRRVDCAATVVQD